MGTVYEALAAVQRDLPAVKKDQSGSGVNFNYRGIDAVTNALHPLLGKHGLIISPEVIEHSTSSFTVRSGAEWTMAEVVVRYHLLGEDGSFVPPEHCPVGIAQGSDNGDKAFGKAMSYAYKSAISQLFSIPTDDPEMDNEFRPAPDRAAQVSAPPRERKKPPPVPSGPVTPEGTPITADRLAKGFLSLSPEGTVKAVKAFDDAGLPSVHDLGTSQYVEAYGLLANIVAGEKEAEGLQ